MIDCIEKQQKLQRSSETGGLYTFVGKEEYGKRPLWENQRLFGKIKGPLGNYMEMCWSCDSVFWGVLRVLREGAYDS